MKDLFGYEIQETKLTFEQEYKEYISSAAWKRIRDAKIKSVGEKCEVCGKSKWSTHLEVHHLHYRNFKHEHLEDLQVVCKGGCHAQADNFREADQTLRSFQKHKNGSLWKGFDAWMVSGHGDDWASQLSDRKIQKEQGVFLENIRRNSGKLYKLNNDTLTDVLEYLRGAYGRRITDEVFWSTFTR